MHFHGLSKYIFLNAFEKYIYIFKIYLKKYTKKYQIYRRKYMHVCMYVCTVYNIYKLSLPYITELRVHVTILRTQMEFRVKSEGLG